MEDVVGAYCRCLGHTVGVLQLVRTPGASRAGFAMTTGQVEDAILLHPLRRLHDQDHGTVPLDVHVRCRLCVAA